MSEVIFTNHSILRCQQRGINQEVAKFIYKYGAKVNTHGEKKYFINKKKLNSLKYKEKDFISKNDKHILSTAIVCSNNIVVTVMKITNKVIWH
jgi:hypothetical protein